MIGTDASGQGSCLYGKTRDHVLELTTVLLDGTAWVSSPLDDHALAAIEMRDDLVGAVHRTVASAHRENVAAIAATFPKLNRCLTGYDLDHIRNPEGLFDLNAILCGSEGTLGFIAEAKLRVLQLPRARALVNVSYGSFDAALRDAPNLVALNAASVETMDSLVLQLGRGDSSWPKIASCFPNDPDGLAAALNLVEFVADSEAELDERLANVGPALGVSSSDTRRGYGVTRRAADIKNIWEMRKRAAGMLGNVHGDKRPIPFVEDTAVPPERLADYIGEFRDLLDRRGLKYGMFGHVDAGVLHVRPAIDMKDPTQEVLIREITDEVVALTLKYGGLLWGARQGTSIGVRAVLLRAALPSAAADQARIRPGQPTQSGKDRDAFRRRASEDRWRRHAWPARPADRCPIAGSFWRHNQLQWQRRLLQLRSLGRDVSFLEGDARPAPFT